MPVGMSQFTCLSPC